MHDAEDRSARSDAKREGQDRRRGDDRRPSQAAPGVSKILPQHAQMFRWCGPSEIHQQTAPEAPPAFVLPAVAVQPASSPRRTRRENPSGTGEATRRYHRSPGVWRRHDVLRLGVRPAARACRSSVVSRSASACATSRPNTCEPVVSAPFVVVLGTWTFVELDDQAVLEHPLDGSVQRAGTELHPAVRASGDILHDGVAMPILIGESDQNLEHGRLQRNGERGLFRWISRHEPTVT